MKLPALATVRLWLLMLLPFVLWGTAMTAMAPLLESGGDGLLRACAFYRRGLSCWFGSCSAAGL